MGLKKAFSYARTAMENMRRNRLESGETSIYPDRAKQKCRSL